MEVHIHCGIEAAACGSISMALAAEMAHQLGLQPHWSVKSEIICKLMDSVMSMLNIVLNGCHGN